jgi:hypothetical protein
MLNPTDLLRGQYTFLSTLGGLGPSSQQLEDCRVNSTATAASMRVSAGSTRAGAGSVRAGPRRPASFLVPDPLPTQASGA